MTFLGVANEKLILPNPQAFRIISEADELFECVSSFCDIGA